MDNVRDLGLALSAVCRRLDEHDRELHELNVLVQERMTQGSRSAEALRAAEELGISVSRFRRLWHGRKRFNRHDHAAVEDRRRVVVALRGRGWTHQQIALALSCTERSVERHLAS